jgi:four helix bundle protein
MTKDKGSMTRKYPVPNRKRPSHLVTSDETDELEFWGHRDEELILREGETVAERAYDLVERTARFGEAIIRFCKKVPRNPVNTPLIGQLVRSGTSVGANYCEADDAVSKKDFKNRIGTCRKEAKETKHWLRMIACAEDALKPDARTVWREARELHLIFCATFNRS